MNNRWIKRRTRKKSIKGRVARGLLWRESVYREWFEFAKISTLVPAYPKEFGDLDQFDNFEEWWDHPSYGFELFCEPEEKGLVEEATPTGSIEKYYLYLKVFLKADLEICMARIEELLNKKRQGLKTPQHKSMAKFQPSIEMKNFKVEVLQRQRDVWVQTNSGVKKEKMLETVTYNTLDKNGESLKDSELFRYLSRDMKRANAIFESISKGTFP